MSEQLPRHQRANKYLPPDRAGDGQERWTIRGLGNFGKPYQLSATGPLLQPEETVEVVPAEHADALAEAVEHLLAAHARRYLRLRLALTRYRQATPASTGKESDG